MWLIYALGGGWGHLTRAASLARAAASKHHVQILTNSPYVEHVRAAMPELDIVTAATREDAVREILNASPSRLIVDTFPRGLGGELAGVLDSVRAKKILLHRDLNPAYVGRARLREFVAKHFDLVLLPGEGDAFPGIPTPPWLIRSREELTASHARGILICPAGKAEESAWYDAVGDSLAACGGLMVRQAWPAMDVFPQASVVIGGGGYNTVHECLALGVPLVACAWPRKYDRQSVRLERAARQGVVIRVDIPEQAAAAAIELSRTPRANCAVPQFVNGAHDAVRLIAGA
jgi:UDP:flavonoid glycosyltransferase YjiC (YdhE family)